MPSDQPVRPSYVPDDWVPYKITLVMWKDPAATEKDIDDDLKGLSNKIDDWTDYLYFQEWETQGQ